MHFDVFHFGCEFAILFAFVCWATTKDDMSVIQSEIRLKIRRTETYWTKRIKKKKWRRIYNKSQKKNRRETKPNIKKKPREIYRIIDFYALDTQLMDGEI